MICAFHNHIIVQPRSRGRTAHLLWFRGRLIVRDRLQHGLRGECQFLRHEVGDHVGPSPHVLPSLVVVVRAVDLQLKPLSINVRQKTSRLGP